MKKISKIIAVALVLSMFVIPLNTQVACASTVSEKQAPIYDSRYVGVNTMSIRLETLSSIAKVDVKMDIRNGYYAEVDIHLVESENKFGWSESNSWGTSLSGDDEVTKYLSIEDGMYYKVEVVADIYTSSGAFVETIKGTSQIEQA
ncbi:MAG: hypothetical protein R3Y32_07020 [Bacillota bacterium]